MPELTKEEALTIAQKHISSHLNSNIKITYIENTLRHGRLYATPKDCWYIYFDSNPDIIGLKSSDLICISKKTGEIKYMGSASDEG
ncbi:hypothetical protein M0R36_03975 [bacterium]|jgi:hypothetical protein|nr:hypothetical protein [bacterium]